jgi:uncharacterized protein
MAERSGIAGSKDKLAGLKEIIRSLGSLLVAFSGGVDSTFLVAVARRVLPRDSVLAVTAVSPIFPERELAEARRLAKILDVEQRFIQTRQLDDPVFRSNPPDRCYICKKSLFLQFHGIARRHHLTWVVEGSTLDDRSNRRPGRRAVEELEVRSPLEEAGLTKADVRRFSKEWRLPTWNKPSLACLASRFPYGDRFTEEGLLMVERAEKFLSDLGFRQVRVRLHGEMARVEIEREEMRHFLEPAMRDHVVRKLNKLGFVYVTLDLAGYRSGSMDEVLPSGGSHVPQ